MRYSMHIEYMDFFSKNKSILLVEFLLYAYLYVCKRIWIQSTLWLWFECILRNGNVVQMVGNV